MRRQSKYWISSILALLIALLPYESLYAVQLSDCDNQENAVHHVTKNAEAENQNVSYVNSDHSEEACSSVVVTGAFVLSQVSTVLSAKLKSSIIPFIQEHLVQTGVLPLLRPPIV